MSHLDFLAAAATRAASINAEKGWHDGWSLDMLVPKLALVATEVREWSQEEDPLKAENELADIVIRIMDIAELMEQDGFRRGLLLAGFRDGKLFDIQESTGLYRHRNDLLLQTQLYGDIADAVQAYRKVPVGDDESVPDVVLPLICRCAMRALVVLEVESGGRYQQVITRVLEANAQRPYKHGGRRI